MGAPSTHPSSLHGAEGSCRGKHSRLQVFAWGFAGVHRAGVQEAAGTRVLGGGICRQMGAISA